MRAEHVQTRHVEVGKELGGVSVGHPHCQHRYVLGRAGGSSTRGTKLFQEHGSDRNSSLVQGCAGAQDARWLWAAMGTFRGVTHNGSCRG